MHGTLLPKFVRWFEAARLISCNVCLKTAVSNSGWVEDVSRISEIWASLYSLYPQRCVWTWWHCAGFLLASSYLSSLQPEAMRNERVFHTRCWDSLDLFILPPNLKLGWIKASVHVCVVSCLRVLSWGLRHGCWFTLPVSLRISTAVNWWDASAFPHWRREKGLFLKSP